MTLDKVIKLKFPKSGAERFTVWDEFNQIRFSSEMYAKGEYPANLLNKPVTGISITGALGCASLMCINIDTGEKAMKELLDAAYKLQSHCEQIMKDPKRSCKDCVFGGTHCIMRDECPAGWDIPIWRYSMNTPKVIDCFDGEYAFLSNFYPVVMHFGMHTYLNSEAAFQAQKCVSEYEMRQFCDLPPGKAKRLGRRVQLRSDWERVKDDIMYRVVLAKFSQHPNLAQQLYATGDAELIEGNTWGDRYWGAVDGVGANKLGKILMRIRSELPNLTIKISDTPIGGAR